MATRPNAKDYALPPSCINADENAEGGLAKHLEPLCLSLAERVLLYNQEVLFLQGKEILQGLAKLNANSVAAAAGDGGLTPAASSEPAAAGTRRVRPWAEAFASAARSARGLASAFEMKAKAEEDDGKVTPSPLMLPRVTRITEAPKRLRDGVKESTRRAAKAVQPNDKDILSDAQSSATEGRERVTTKAGGKSHARQTLLTGVGGHDMIKSNGPQAVAGRCQLTEQQRKVLARAREMLAREIGNKNIVPRDRTATVIGKTVEMDGANTARIKEKKLNKRVRSPIPTSHIDVEDGRPRRASKQAMDLHPNKKVKIEVKSEPGNGGL